MHTSLLGGIAMLKQVTTKAGEIWTVSSELYREMTLSAMRLVPGRR